MHDQVKEYYGKILASTNDLKTNACCTNAAYPEYIRTALENVHDEVLTRYYGCGLVAPQALEETHILDLGSGSGRDCYVLGQLVGEKGRIVGVDMTDEQLEVANRHIGFHREKFGYAKSNVEFKKGYIEKLDELDLVDNSFDVIVSNCVINNTLH
jgi:arsenite methyltransferase